LIQPRLTGAAWTGAGAGRPPPGAAVLGWGDAPPKVAPPPWAGAVCQPPFEGGAGGRLAGCPGLDIGQFDVGRTGVASGCAPGIDGIGAPPVWWAPGMFGIGAV
jgi:hypothetical protein